MSDQDAEFLKRLLGLFRIEADEHMRALTTGLIELEQAAGSERQPALVETLLREAHNLKGAARAVNLVDVESVCQALESALASLKRRELAPTPPVVDVLHQAVDGLVRLIAASTADPPAAEKPRIAGLIQQLEILLAPASSAPVSSAPAVEAPAAEAPPSPPAPVEPAPAIETTRIATARLDALFLQAEELLAAKLAARQRVDELQQLAAQVQTWKQEWAKVRAATEWARPAASGAPKGEARLREFLGWTEDFMAALDDRLGAASQLAEGDRRQVEEKVDTLLQDMKQVLLMPFAGLLEVFPGLVRDLARAQGKAVDLLLSGAEVEMDRRLLQELKDPLMHLVRNALDHGIERPEERERQGKPPRGTLTLAATPKEGNKVEIVIRDDGAGIDPARVRAAALRLGQAPAEALEALNEQGSLDLIFHSGLSTSPLITDISGRGLGLAIVRDKVDRLGGSVAVETERGAGTTFRLLLPLTLATLRGVLIVANEQPFVLPTTYVERVALVAPADIETVENRETVLVDGQAVALVRLADALGLPANGSQGPARAEQLVVVVSVAGRRLAFGVDEVVGEQEVLVKPLGPQLARVRNISGATVLGTGQLVPMLEAADLVKSAIRSAAVPRRGTAAAAPAAERKHVLVVEDSITARALLKNILEAAGYRVTTAVDGQEAFSRLQAEAFDVVVTDVEMPRLNGFDLTRKIRAEADLADLPVVLVTALESQADRERGLEAGANAYLVKRSFDQSNLLEVIQRLA